MNRLFIRAAVLLALCVSTLGLSQSASGGIAGKVVDATGAFIPGVTLTATEVLSAAARETLTNESGVYTFANLPPGVYTISAALPGFAPMRYTDVSVQVMSVGARVVPLSNELRVLPQDATHGQLAVILLDAHVNRSIGVRPQRFQILTARAVRGLPRSVTYPLAR